MNPGNRLDLSRGNRDLYLLIASGLLAVSSFLFQEWRLTGALTGVPLDDSWIHYRFSHNLRAGEGFSFNPGLPTPGSTSPLWVLLLSLLGGGYLIPSKVIGILSYLGTGLLVYQLALQLGLSSGYSLLAGLSTLVTGRLLWSAPSGMETTTFTLLTLLFLWMWARSPRGDIKPAASLVLGLACLLRPEGYLLLGLSGIVWLFFPREDRSWSTRFKSLARHYLLAGLVVLPYFLFSFSTTGNFLPNTFYAKSGAWDCRPGLAYFAWISAVFFLDNPIVAFFALVGLLTLLVTILRTNQSIQPAGWFTLAGLWLFTLPVLYGFIAPCMSGYYTRYTAPLIPIFMLAGVFGAHRLSAWLRDRQLNASRPSPKLPLVAALLIEGLLISLLPSLLFWAPYYGRSVSDLESMHIPIAHWLVENTSPGDVIALNDIGVIGFISDRQVIDLMGLVNPDTLPLVAGKKPGEWDESLAIYLQHMQPGYLIVFPNWFPTMAAKLPVEELLRIRLEDRTIAGIQGITVLGGGEMVVYRLNW